MGLGAVETLIERDRRIKREQRNRLLGIVSVFVSFGFFCALAGFLGGYRYGFDQAQAQEAAKPKRVVHVVEKRAPFPGLVECIRTCRAVDRSERIVQK